MTNCTRFQYLDYVRTTYRKAFRADSKCASGILWTVTAQNWNKSFTNIKHRAGAVGREGLVNWIFPSISVGPSLFPTYSLPLRPEYLFTPHQSEAQNLSDIWRSTFEISRRSFAPLQYRNSAKNQWRIQGWGPGARPPLFLDQTEVQRAVKNFSRDWGPPPYPRVWMTTPPPYFKVWIWKSPFFRVNRGSTRYGFSAAANANRYSVNVSLIKLPLHCIYTEIILLFFLQFLVWYAEVFSHL